MIDDQEGVLQDILDTFLNRLSDGSWHWWCPTPSGGTIFKNRKEALDEFLAYSKKMAAKVRKKNEITGKRLDQNGAADCRPAQEPSWDIVDAEKPELDQVGSETRPAVGG